MSAISPATITRVAVGPEFDFAGPLAFFRLRALPGIERVTAERFVRHVWCAGAAGCLEVARPAPETLEISVRHPAASVRAALLATARKLFDLDADAPAMRQHLTADPRLAPLLQARGDVRVPGAMNAFEVAVRAILGQQVSVAAACTFAARMMAQLGTPFTTLTGAAAHDFPTAEGLAAADLSRIGLTSARCRTLISMARAVRDDAVPLQADDLDAFIKAWTQLPGIGPWTAHYIALRLHQPDAFPAADLGLRKALASAGSRLASAREVRARSTPWRPWRAYATLLLWHGLHD